MRVVHKNLVLDERLLEEAVRLSGEGTYSRVVPRGASGRSARQASGREPA